MDLTEEQWTILAPLIGEEMPSRAVRRGKPWRSSRKVLNGDVWISRTGTR